MIFNEWWENRLKTHFAGDEGNGLDAWIACKNEILKTIKDIDIAQRNAYLVLAELKQKIENL